MLQSIPKIKKQPKFTYPPDLQSTLQIIFVRSSSPPTLNEDDQLGLECECCERIIGSEQTSSQCCCYSDLQLAFMGPGIPLFFQFLVNAIFLLGALSLVFVGFALYSNIVSTECSIADKCQTALDTVSITNKVNEQNYLSIQNYTLLAFVVLCFFLLQYFRYTFRKVQDDCDQAIDSPSDYAMILRRLPPDVEVSDIQHMIEERRGFLTPQQRVKTQNLRVINIIMSFAMGQYVQVEEENLQQFGKFMDEDKTDQFIPKPLPKLNQYATVAIVVFARQQSKEFFKYTPNICQKFLQCLWSPCLPRSDYVIKDQKVAIERAPQPDDINWRNCKISEMGAICRKVLYSLISILVLFTGGAIQYGLAVAKVNAPQDETTQLALSAVSSICVAILNIIIQLLLIFLSQKQRNETKTEFYTVVMVKISFFQFLNTGVFVILSTFLADTQGFNIFKGVIFEVVLVMSLNAITPNLVQIVLVYFELIHKIKRCLIERNVLKKSQLDANLIWQGPEIDIAFKYAYIFKTIWLTAFYAPLAPIVVPISIIGLTINLFLEKILFSKSYSIPNTISSILNDSAIQLLEYFPLILTLGQFVVYSYIKNFRVDLLPQYWSIPIYVALGLCIINLLLPMDALNMKIFTLPTDNMVYPDYEKVEEKFQVTYEMTNPGYECKRKRKRDKFIMNKLFGATGQGMPMGAILGGGPNNPGNETKAGLAPNSNNIYSPQQQDENNPFKALLGAKVADNNPQPSPFEAAVMHAKKSTNNQFLGAPKQNVSMREDTEQNINNNNQTFFMPPVAFENTQLNEEAKLTRPANKIVREQLSSNVIPFDIRESMNINPVSPGYEMKPIDQSGYYKPAKKVYESQKRSERSQEEREMRQKFKLPEASTKKFKRFELDLANSIMLSHKY